MEGWRARGSGGVIWEGELHAWRPREARPPAFRLAKAEFILDLCLMKKKSKSTYAPPVLDPSLAQTLWCSFFVNDDSAFPITFSALAKPPAVELTCRSTSLPHLPYSSYADIQGLSPVTEGKGLL